MPTYRKKPVEIEAHRLNGNLEIFRDMEDVSLTFEGVQTDDPHALAYATVQTEEGPLKAWPGDWIITGIEGECYPCKDSVFQATYEQVNDEPTRKASAETVPTEAVTRAFGAYIKRARTDCDLTQREAADRIGIDHTYLSKLERGRMAPPSRATLVEMALTYHKPVHEVVAKGGKIPEKVRDYLCDNPAEIVAILRKARGGKGEAEEGMGIQEAVRSARGGDPVEDSQGYA
jgi:transcriptional regulator with XRE-family HTH domain